MNTLVIDASVAIKWVIDEPGTAEAMALRRFGLLAPDLLVPECANILWKKLRRGELEEAEALMAARLLERAEIDLVPMRRMLERAIALSLALNHPAYDCVYLCVAEFAGAAFVTADERLCNKVLACGGLPIEIHLLTEASRLLERLDGKVTTAAANAPHRPP